jgi:protein-disulfide isomerase
MSKQFLAVIAAVVIIFIGIFAISNHKSGSTGNSSKPTNHVEGLGQDHVTLVEYGDYQCPYCGEYYPTIKQVQAEYNTQITFQFRNFPLTSLHPNAFAGARAAEAAGLQNKYWQMHDLLYDQNVEYYNSNQQANTWIGASDPSGFFDSYAKQLGLNVQKFESDYSSSEVNNLINADMAAGNKLKINATPTFILDGKVLTNPSNTVSAFQSLINAEIAKKAKTEAPTAQ